MANSRIYREGNRIVFQGAYGVDELHRPLAALHQAIENTKYSEVIFDFRDCTSAHQGSMIALCAQAARIQKAQIDTNIILPNDEKISRLFRNTNWAHIISPRQHDQSTFRGYTQIPVTQYKSSEEQFKIVNKIANAILGAIPELEREDFAALEWSINELTDNVLVHSQSAVGGFIQVSTFQRQRKRLQFMVADAGLGIPNTLREGHPSITSDTDALDKAIREGVTRDKKIGQGNGLYGSYEICSKSKGRFQLESGYAKLTYNEKHGLHIKNEPVPYEGTLLIAEIDFSSPKLLAEALNFNGKKHSPLDYIEKYYEHPKNEELIFKISQESDSFGSRVAGTPLRQKLINLSKMCPDQRINIDFQGVALVSSSFADELIGKLFLEVGPVTFMSRFNICGISPTVQALIDRAISQRMAEGNR